MDDERVKAVGPNMACAEWLMRNGAQVRWKGCKEFVSHYDCLPKGMSCNSLKQFQIEQVFAGKEASIGHIGFRHFGMYIYGTIRPCILKGPDLECRFLVNSKY